MSIRLADPLPSASDLNRLARNARYVGSPKHKLNSAAFGMAPVHQAGDATLCDRDAGFTPEKMQFIPSYLSRGIQAGLISGSRQVIWAIADDGWIFEGRITNSTLPQYHGYPVRPGEPNARPVYDRFSVWVKQHPRPRHCAALAACRELYGFRP